MNWEIFSTNLLAHETLHLVFGGIISFFIYRRYKSPKLVLVVFLVSFLVDLDHYLEGLLVNGFNFNWVFTLAPGIYWEKAGKMTLFFHSWEIIPIVLLIGRRIKNFSLALAIALSLLGHYLVDQAVYSSLSGMSLLEYSIIYRLIHRFDFKALCRDC